MKISLAKMRIILDLDSPGLDLDSPDLDLDSPDFVDLDLDSPDLDLDSPDFGYSPDFLPRVPYCYVPIAHK